MNSSTSFIVSLNSIDKVKKFVNIVSNFEEDFDLIHDRYIIDAKSIMGVFSLDLTKEINLVVHTDDTSRFEEIKSALAAFAV